VKLLPILGTSFVASAVCALSPNAAMAFTCPSTPNFTTCAQFIAWGAYCPSTNPPNGNYSCDASGELCSIYIAHRRISCTTTRTTTTTTTTGRPNGPNMGVPTSNVLCGNDNPEVCDPTAGHGKLKMEEGNVGDSNNGTDEWGGRKRFKPTPPGIRVQGGTSRLAAKVHCIRWYNYQCVQYSNPGSHGGLH
jgi:hypothetical protein